ncbi:MAG TPA: hypothetical protein VEL73_02410 [Mycobacteriales bacterium]|nr:hypothetical protein [Mycobacteriales bacterium]
MADARALRPVSRGTKVLLGIFVALTALATNQLFVLSAHTAEWFAWTINPPLTAAFLGAGYGAGFLLVLLALRSRAWAYARVPVVTVLVFAALTLAATLLHRDRFHFTTGGPIAEFAAWFWLAVYLVVPVALALLVVLQARKPGADAERRRPLPRWLAAVLTVQGAIMLAVGIVLFASPRTAKTLWPWSLTPLTARMVAAWLIAFGVASTLALWERDLQRLEIAAVAYTVFGLLQLVALIRYGDEVRWGSVAAKVYLVVLVTLPPTGAVGWWISVRARRRRAAGAPPAAAARAG